jgi:ribose 1,5-bisphosphokinase
MALIYTIGPSGAGKDSLLTWLRQHLPPQARIHFAQRCITRARLEGDEQHEPMDPALFAKASDDGEFVFHWHANQLDYGIRHREIEGLKHGHSVVINGSRTHLMKALDIYPELIVLQITASFEVLRKRLESRGRESAAAIEARLQRSGAMPTLQNTSVIEIRNDHTIEIAGTQLLTAFEERGLLA